MHTRKEIQYAIRRFHQKINKTDTCWLWTGGVNSRNGRGLSYGKWRPYPRPHPHVYAHRFAYETFVGPIPDEMMVCHDCDVPLCVNPSHLFLGTAKDNFDDCVKKGRFSYNHNIPAKGESNGRAKLNDERIRVIRGYKGKLSSSEVGRMFDVDRSSIQRIWSGIRWSHVL